MLEWEQKGELCIRDRKYYLNASVILNRDDRNFRANISSLKLVDTWNLPDLLPDVFFCLAPILKPSEGTQILKLLY